MAGNRKVVLAGLAGNVLVAISKFIAATLTHSSAMLSEAIHSLVDCLNQVVMLHGMRRASRPPSREHPFGHGRELYFWSFVVAVMIFALGAGVSMYEGVHHIRHPVTIENPWINYGVLGLAALFESGSWFVAFREFRSRKGDLGYFEAAQETKDPSTLTVFLEDSAALVGIAFALAGTAASHLLGDPVYDGLASIAIGLLLAAVSVFLARETKQLLIGEGADREIEEQIREIARDTRGVVRVNGLLTVHLSPRQVVVAMSVEFDDSLRAPQIEAAVEDIEARIRREHPEVVMILMKPQTGQAYERALRARKFSGFSGG